MFHVKRDCKFADIFIVMLTCNGKAFSLHIELGIKRASPGAAVKLCLGDLLVMGSNPETASLHMQG